MLGLQQWTELNECTVLLGFATGGRPRKGTKSASVCLDAIQTSTKDILNSPDGGQLSERRVVLVEGLFSFPCGESSTAHSEPPLNELLVPPPPQVINQLLTTWGQQNRPFKKTKVID